MTARDLNERPVWAVLLIALPLTVACRSGSTSLSDAGQPGTDAVDGPADHALADHQAAPDDRSETGSEVAALDWSVRIESCGFPSCAREIFLRCQLPTPTTAATSDACRITTSETDASPMRDVALTYANGVKIRKAGDAQVATVLSADGSVCYREDSGQILDPQGKVIATYTFVGGLGAYADISCGGAPTRVFGDCVDLLVTPVAGGYFCSSEPGLPTGASRFPNTGTGMDAGTDRPPAGIDRVDSVACSGGVACPSGLCRAGKCVPRYAGSQPFIKGFGTVDWLLSAPDGGFYVVGTTGLQVIFDPLGRAEIYNPARANTIFVVKLDAGGKFVWRHTFGPSAGVAVRPAVLSDGSLLYAGASQGVTFDSGLQVDLNASNYVVKFSPDGSYQWIKTLPGSTVISAVATTSQGGMVLGGNFNYTVNFNFAGDAPLTGGDNGGSLFVAAYDGDANYRWARAFPDTAFASLSSIAVSADQSLTLLGRFGSKGSLGTSTIAGGEPFAAHLDATNAMAGPPAWARTYPQQDPATALIASGGALYELTSKQLVKRDVVSGQPLWTIDSPGWNFVGLAPSPTGVVLGGTVAAFDFDLDPADPLRRPGVPYGSPFLAAYGGDDHRIQWVREPTVSFGRTFSTDAAGNVSVVILANLPTDLDPGPGTDVQAPPSSTGSTAYLMRFTP